MPLARPSFRRALVFVAALCISLPAVQQNVDAASGRALRLLSLLNSERTSRGLRALTMSSSINSIAEAHAARMARAGRLYHNENLGSQIKMSWTAIGENVGRGPSTDSIHRAWMGSSSHRANILNPRFTLVGIGVVERGGQLWAVQDFAAVSYAPRSRPRVSRSSVRRAYVVPPPKPRPRVHVEEAREVLWALKKIVALGG